MRFLPLLLLAPALSGCVVASVAKTAVDVATLPVKAVSAGVDAVTTSQSEADEKRGRDLRREEERRGKALRQWQDDCRKRTRAGQPCDPQPS
jgi:isocitrate lyase